MKKLSLVLLLLLLLSQLGPLAAFPAYAQGTESDEFNSETLGDQWTWTREPSGDWDLTGTALQISTTATDLFEATNTAPLLLQDVPEGDKYEISTKVTFGPDTDYQQAGLIFYTDDGNYLELTWQWNGLTTELEFTREVAGAALSYFYQPAPSASFLYLKIERFEDIYTGSYSTDGTTWYVVGQYVEMPTVYASMGLTAYHGTGATSEDADFDYFHYATVELQPELWAGWFSPQFITGDWRSPYVWTGTASSGTNHNPITRAQIRCRGTGCTTLRDVRYFVSLSLAWETGFNPDLVWVNAYEDGNGTGTYQQQAMPCGSGHAGNCANVFTGVIPAEDIGTDPSTSYHVEAGTTLDESPDAVYSVLSWSWTVEFRFDTPTDDCSEQFIVLTSDGPYEIDPALEFPDGDPDEQTYTTIENQFYQITTSGGPWDDGPNANRYDAAISWDGTNYVSVNSLIETAECVSYDPDNPALLSIYVQAESTTLYVRANDLPGWFADNTAVETFYYSISLVISFEDTTACGDEFTYDEEEDWVASINLASTSIGSLVNTADLTVGDWYVVEIASGSWLDGGVGSPRNDLEYDFDYSTSNPLTGYADLNSGNEVWCQLDDGTLTFVQASDLNLWLRVNDDSLEDFADNTGTLGINLYHAAFERIPELCETTFNISDLVLHNYVQAIKENGDLFGTAFAMGELQTGTLVSGAYYMLETSGDAWGYKGVGHGLKAYDAAIRVGAGDWQSFSDWEDSLCTVEIDGLGHQRIYFQVPPDTNVDYWIRVNDTAEWNSNVGGITYDLYQAIDLEVETPSGECDYIYDLDHPVYHTIVQGNDEDGDNITPYILDTDFFAVVVNTGTYWQEYSGGDDLTDAQLQYSTDNGATWSDIPPLCSYEGGPGVVMFYKESGYRFRVRVDSSSFANNTGALDINVYAATTGDTIDPWITCLDGNTLNVINSFEWIPVKKEEGAYVNGTTMIGQEQVPLLIAGETYAIELLEGPWYDATIGGDPHYDAALSSDDGATWYPINEHPAITCGEQDQLGWYWTVVFTAEEGDRWKIRVNDSAGEFWDNVGSLAYKLYEVQGPDVPPLPDGFPEYTSAIDFCSIPLVRPMAPVAPDSVLDVVGWLEYISQIIGSYIPQYIGYLRNTSISFFAWCPRHSNALLALMDAVKTKEPLATILEWLGIYEDMKTELDGYNWEGGGGSGAPPPSLLTVNSGSELEQVIDTYILPRSNASNPWDGGDISLSSGSGVDVYNTECYAVLSEFTGDNLAGGACFFVSAWSMQPRVAFWVQVLIDVAALAACIASVVGGAINLWSYFTSGVIVKGGEM
jgi:hypothetical protein